LLITPQALTPSFSQLLSQLVYSQAELRAPILKALKIMIDSNVLLASRDESQMSKLPASVLEDPISPSEAEENLNYLKTQVESWLAVLFNVFGVTDRDRRGPIGDVISAWTGIADVEVCSRLISCIFVLDAHNSDRIASYECICKSSGALRTEFSKFKKFRIQNERGRRCWPHHHDPGSSTPSLTVLVL
jgi:hypothetical protein